jgi:hypothetical protein
MARPISARLPILGFAFLMGVSPLASYASGDSPPAKSGSGTSASSLGASAVAPNQAVNSQTAAGSVYQSPLGGVNNNYQINNGQDTSLGFGPGIFCRGPNLWVSGFGAGAGLGNYTSNSFGGAVTLSIPLGNAVDMACRENVQEIARQRRLDTAFILAKKCAEFAQSGLRVDYSLPSFAQLKDCEGITPLPQREMAAQAPPIPVPPPIPAPTPAPIPGLW